MLTDDEINRIAIRVVELLTENNLITQSQTDSLSTLDNEYTKKFQNEIQQVELTNERVGVLLNLTAYNTDYYLLSDIVSLIEMTTSPLSKKHYKKVVVAFLASLGMISPAMYSDERCEYLYKYESIRRRIDTDRVFCIQLPNLAEYQKLYTQNLLQEDINLYIEQRRSTYLDVFGNRGYETFYEVMEHFDRWKTGDKNVRTNGLDQVGSKAEGLYF